MERRHPAQLERRQIAALRPIDDRRRAAAEQLRELCGLQQPLGSRVCHSGSVRDTLRLTEHPAMAADPELPDLDALAIELVQLERRSLTLRRTHHQLLERLAAFPNEVTVATERKIADELESVTARILQIDALLLPLRRAR
jgi:hypothetical protein